MTRNALASEHPKVRELVLADFNTIGNVAGALGQYDACFFCAGVSSIGMSEQDYRAVTYDLTLNVAKVLAQRNPAMTSQQVVRLMILM